MNTPTKMGSSTTLIILFLEMLKNSSVKEKILKSLGRIFNFLKNQKIKIKIK
jgi:hypothetical protein